MDKVREYALLAWRWIEGRNTLTLAVGYGIGALTDDWIIGLLRVLL